jgi:hypothetical protein
MFFVFGGEIIEFNLMRNVKSILLFLLSLKYLQERRILPYMLLNVLGMSFHITSVIYLPLYFALHREFPKWLLWTVFIVGNVLFLLQVQYIQPLFTFVGNMLGGKIPWMVTFYFSDTSYGISVGYIERTLSFVLIMLLRPALTRQDKSNLLFFNMYVIYAICFLYFGEAQVVTLRISYLFIGAYWFLFPNALYALRKRLNRQIMLLLIVAYSVIKALLWHASAEMEYDNLMFGIKKYEERTHVFHTLDNRQKNE